VAHLQRHVKARALEALHDTRIVVIQGARQVGKTTLVQEILAHVGGQYVTLDDPSIRAAAQLDPVGFVMQNRAGLLAVDEVQRVPELMLALKLEVDRDPRPGRFLITGSADLLRLPTVEDSLAGRAESIELHGFSQGELSQHLEQFIDHTFANNIVTHHTSKLGRADYLERAMAGSFPEVINRSPGRRRQDWLDNYLTRITERDAPDISSLRSIPELSLVLRLIAAQNSGELNTTKLSQRSGIPTTSLTRLLGLLETLYLVQRIPAWSTNLTKRVVTRPKVALLDTGMAARLQNVSPASASPNVSPTVAGHLLEGFVAGELRRQRAWAEEVVQLCHFRDHSVGEVDLVLESIDGRVVGIEVKAAATVGTKDVRGLELLRDRLGARFIRGYVLYTGAESVPFGDRITAAPLDLLWSS